jgi:hypothetical protein
MSDELQLFLAIWISPLAILAAVLLLLNLKNSVRELRRSGVHRPALVIRKRLFGLLRRPPTKAHSLVDRLALVSWDLRWIATGTSLARVSGPSADGAEIDLDLQTPIRLSGMGSAPPRTLRFKPNRPGAYETAAVRGTLDPPIEGVIATAQVVLLS